MGVSPPKHTHPTLGSEVVTIISIMGKFLQRLLREMGLKRVKRRYHVNLRMAEYLESMALEQARDPEEIAVGLLAEGIAKHARIEQSFEYWGRLTPREQEVVALICLGYMNKEIGEKLGIATQTVKSHVSNILRRLDFNRRGEIQRLLMDWDFSEWDR